MSIFPKNDPEFDLIAAEEAAMVDAAETLAEALEHSGMSRADLARALGVSPGEVTVRLRGERNITVRKLAATAHAMGRRLHVGLEPLEDEPAAPFADSASDESSYSRWRRPLSAASDSHLTAPARMSYR